MQKQKLNLFCIVFVLFGRLPVPENVTTIHVNIISLIKSVSQGSILIIWYKEKCD